MTATASENTVLQVAKILARGAARLLELDYSNNRSDSSRALKKNTEI